MKLLFAKPTYGPVADPTFDQNHRVAIMRAANHGITWVGDASPDRLAFATARNKVVETALEADHDYGIDGVFWVDSDVIIPADAIHQLVEHGLDFVSGLYFQRNPPYYPLFARYIPKRETFEFGKIYPENTVAPCDGVGFGCVYTSIKLLKLVSKMPECKAFGPFGGDFGRKTYGEDFTFCLRAKKVGIQPHIDTGIKCDHHSGPEFSNEALFRSAHLITGGK
jgi:hypothetical protein